MGSSLKCRGYENRDNKSLIHERRISTSGLVLEFEPNIRICKVVKIKSILL